MIVESSGCDHLFGGETALLDDLVERLTRGPYRSRGARRYARRRQALLACFGDDDPADRIAPAGGGW